MTHERDTTSTPPRPAGRSSTTTTHGWTDGLPVVPVTESYLAEFLATTGRDPDEVLIPMPHLNKNLTVRLAAINAALAGCLPEYFPVVLAAWDSFLRDGMVTRSIWQSTTGTAPFSWSTGRLRQRLGLNSRGNVWGSGFRANATIGRAIRLGAINGLGLKPHVFDQATQGTPAKYSCCIAENEEDSPWPSLAADNGIGPADSAVSATVIRSVLHIEARHTIAPEQLAADFADSLCRTGALVRADAASGYVVLNPEHARLFDKHGWSKDDVRASRSPTRAGAPTGTSRAPARRLIAKRHRLAAARRPPGRPAAGDAGGPGHPGPADHVRRRGADRGGRRAQRRRVLDRRDVRPVRPRAGDHEGRGEIAPPFIRNVRGLLSGHRVLAGVEHPSRLPGEVGARRREDVDELVDAASHRL